MASGITFKETMAGPFSLDALEPESVLAASRQAATALAMHAEVSIPDLEDFIEHPDHLGFLSGSVDFAPLGTGLQSYRGVFNLFSPGGAADLKLMIYELGFLAHGRPYYLAGEKRVQNNGGFDLWSDTTTLFTRLYEGEGKDGKQVGAGVLSLGVGELADLLSTLRVTGAGSPMETAATVARFGNFFMGELWDSYGPEALRLGGLRQKE